MASARHRLREVYAALDAAESYQDWLAAAREHDALSGAEAWRAEDASEHFDAAALRRSEARLREMREAGDGLGLGEALSEALVRHLGDLASPDLYDTALAGPKHLVQAWLDEVETGLRWLARTPIAGLSPVDKLSRFERAWKVYGRSALLLSGGATWGFFHLGVVKALSEHELLPDILSGASTGAMVAAGVCVRDEAELAALFADTDAIRLDGLLPVGPRRGLSQRAVLDPERLYAVLRHNVGDATFAEAFAHSGRVLSIPVSPTRTRQKPRLLSYLTAPEVLVARAALASSALPALFPPVELVGRGPDGRERPYIPGERWVDGSLHGDLPKWRLARLHNVNHFIVSQANPHVVPFVRHHGRRGLRPAVAGLVGATVRTQAAYATDLVRRAGGSASGPLAQLADRAYNLATQDYRGDIDIHPELDWRLLPKVVVNPSRADLAAFIRAGERATWPQLARIHHQTRLGRAFSACVAQLRSEVRRGGAG